MAQDAASSPSTSLAATFSSTVVYTDTRNSPAYSGNDVQVQVSPGFQLISRSGRVRGSASYSLGLVRHSRDDRSSDDVQNSLNAAFTAEAIPNWLFVDAAATASQNSLSAFGQQSVEGSQQRNNNRTEVGSVSVTPHVSGSIGGFATYDARWQANATNARRSIEADSTSTNAMVSVNSANTGAFLGWSLSGNKQRTSFRAGRATDDDRILASVSLTPDPDWRLTLRGGRESTNVGSLDSESYANWGADVQWTPNERTLARLSKDRRYFGDSHQILLSQRLPLSTLQFTSTQDASTSSNRNGVGQPVTLYQLYFALFASREPDPILRDLLVRDTLRSLGQEPNAQVGGGFLNAAVTLQQRSDLAWTYAGLRTTISLQAFSSRTRLLDTASQQADEGSIVQRGYTSIMSYRLTPTASASLSGSRLLTRGTSVHAGTDLKSLALSLTDQLGRRTSATLGARYSVFNSATDPYRESSVTASVNMRF